MTETHMTEETPALGEKIARARDALIRRVIERLAAGYAAREPELLEEGMVDHVVGSMAALSHARRIRLERELTDLASAIPHELLTERTTSLVVQLRIGAQILVELTTAPERLEAYA